MNLFDRLFPADRWSREAVRFESRVLSYADLRAETLRVVDVLHGLGVRRGDRVAILLAVIGTPHRFRARRQLWPYARAGGGHPHQW